ncbi:MAG: hypothetical protein ACKV2V_05420 [Blastocatellia bacterium]
MTDTARAPEPEIRRNATLVAGSMLATFAALRLYLSFAPDTDLNVGPYNIHHLYSGLLVLIAGAIPLALFREKRITWPLLALGAGLGMTLDEWVFLIATNGSNTAYLAPVSWWGAVVMIALACLYIAALSWRVRQQIEKTDARASQ